MSKHPFAITLDANTSLANKTGSWRNKKPIYVNKIPPCNMVCPAGVDIQRFLAKVQKGDIKGAWNVIVENDPFPAVIGRVCYHPCERACNRNHFDSNVNINLIEKFVGDRGIEEGWQFDSPVCESGKKVLILGSGPAGLTAAYFLRSKGHSVTVFESKKKPGGMLRYGIPSYRLSRAVLDFEIDRILKLGIDLHLNKSINSLDEYLKQYDAVFIASGAHVAPKIGLHESDGQVYDAIELLGKLEDDGYDSISLGDHVVVYGGGNTAIDVARTAIRLGSKSVKIIYRRTQDKMTAHKSEVEEALAEGVEILSLRGVHSIGNNNVVLEVTTEKDGEFVGTGVFEEIVATTTVLAIGQKIKGNIASGIKEIEIDGDAIVINDQMMTGKHGIFAGGDVVTSDRSVTTAIGHGKKAAKCIDAYLKDEKSDSNIKHEIATIKNLNLNYYVHSKGIVRSIQTSECFDEHGISLMASQAEEESRRCFSCGNCFSCDNCYGLCPDSAIKKDKDGVLFIDYDYCKGCGICAKECPCGAIKMLDEDK